jgi:hypothetical protein
MVERGWAGRLLEWRLVGSTLTAEVSRARYFVRSGRHDVTAHAEVRDHPGGQYRLELGCLGVCLRRRFRQGPPGLHRLLRRLADGPHLRRT